MTRPISHLSPNAFLDLPVRIGAGTPSPTLFDKVSVFFAKRWAEVRIAANTVYFAFAYNTIEDLNKQIATVQTYKTAVEGFDNTDESMGRLEAAVLNCPVRYIVHDPYQIFSTRDLPPERKNTAIHECDFLLCLLKVIVKVKEFFLGKSSHTPLPTEPIQLPVQPPNPIPPITPTPSEPQEEPSTPLSPDVVWEALKYRPGDPLIDRPAAADPTVLDDSILSEPESIFLFELNNYPTVLNRQKQITAMAMFLPNDDAFTEVAKEIGEECSESVSKFREKYQCGSLQDGVPMTLPTFHEGVKEDCQDAAVMKSQLKKEDNPYDPEEVRRKCALCNERVEIETVRINLSLQREIAWESAVLLSQMTDEQFVKRLKKLVRVELAEDRTMNRYVSADPDEIAPVIEHNVNKRTDAEILKNIATILNDLPENMNGVPVRDKIIAQLYAHCAEI